MGGLVLPYWVQEREREAWACTRRPARSNIQRLLGCKRAGARRRADGHWSVRRAPGRHRINGPGGVGRPSQGRSASANAPRTTKDRHRQRHVPGYGGHRLLHRPCGARVPTGPLLTWLCLAHRWIPLARRMQRTDPILIRTADRGPGPQESPLPA